jgi:hypothetical protein
VSYSATTHGPSATDRVPMRTDWLRLRAREGHGLVCLCVCLCVCVCVCVYGGRTHRGCGIGHGQHKRTLLCRMSTNRLGAAVQKPASAKDTNQIWHTQRGAGAHRHTDTESQCTGDRERVGRTGRRGGRTCAWLLSHMSRRIARASDKRPAAAHVDKTHPAKRALGTTHRHRHRESHQCVPPRPVRTHTRRE